MSRKHVNRNPPWTSTSNCNIEVNESYSSHSEEHDGEIDLYDTDLDNAETEYLTKSNEAQKKEIIPAASSHKRRRRIIPLLACAMTVSTVAYIRPWKPSHPASSSSSQVAGNVPMQGSTSQANNIGTENDSEAEISSNNNEENQYFGEYDDDFDDFAFFDDLDDDFDTFDNTWHDGSSAQQPDESYEGKGGDTFILPSELRNNLARVDQHDSINDTPMFWLTTPTVVEDMFGTCLNLVQASGVGDSPTEPKLTVMDVDGSKYVNVNMFDYEGIDRAKELELAASKVADVVVVPFFYPGVSLFDSVNRAQMFTVFRHPIQAAVNMYYDSLDTFMMDDDMYMGIEEYANSDEVLDNYLTRSLSNNWERDLTDEDLNMAKEVIGFKCLVGLAENLRESIDRFEKYFGWNMQSDEVKECRNNFFEEEFAWEDEFPILEEGSAVWKALARKNSFDLELYNYAVRVFDEQAVIVRSFGI